ncbi:MAG: small multi-drug export protein [Dehalococcoidia bacterium]|nr:small multi-drug export protein [Dehalococcoidia bacterium]
MELPIRLLAVLGLGALDLWVAFPAGIALGLHPLAVSFTAAAGAVLGASVVLVLGERARTLIMRLRRAGDTGTRHGRIYRVWDRYGAVGLGLISPVLTGAPLGAAIGIAMGARAGRLLLWISAGVVIWSVLLGLAVLLGVEGVHLLSR